MKQFCVSSDCTACGECLLQTNLLEEDPSGHAVPVADLYIRDEEITAAGEVAASCPAHALSIVEKATASLNPEAMIKTLKEKLESVDIPSSPNCKIAFNENDYSVDYGFISGEYSFSYSSESRALSAGKSKFRETFWNRRKDFALSYLAQYKSKLLRPFFDFTDPDKTYFAQFNKQFVAILKEAKAELSAISGDNMILPGNFTAFNPETDHDMQDSFALRWLQKIDSVSYVNDFFEGFEKDKYHRLSYYEDCICSDDDVQVIGTDWLGNNKIKTVYSFYDANSTGQELVDDIASCLSCAGSYGVRYIDDIAEDNVKSLIRIYKDLADKMIQQKISVYTAAVQSASQANKQSNKVLNIPDAEHLTGIKCSAAQAFTQCTEKQRREKILQLCKEGYCFLHSTQNYLIYSKYSSIDSNRKVFRLDLRTLIVAPVPHPEKLRYGPFPIVIGDCIIYEHHSNHIYAYDVEHLRLDELMTYTGRVFSMHASSDYVVVENDSAYDEGVRYLSLKNYSGGVFKRPDRIPYKYLTQKKIYHVNTDGFGASGKGRLEVYNLDKKLGTAFGIVPFDFEPFAEHETTIYGFIRGIGHECTLYTYDTADDKLTKVFQYGQDLLTECKFDISGTLRLFAGENSSENYNVYCLNLDSGEICRLISVKADITLIARFESTLYYTETRHDRETLYAIDLTSKDRSPQEIGLVHEPDDED